MILYLGQEEVYFFKVLFTTYILNIYISYVYGEGRKNEKIFYGKFTLLLVYEYYCGENFKFETWEYYSLGGGAYLWFIRW